MFSQSLDFIHTFSVFMVPSFLEIVQLLLHAVSIATLCQTKFLAHVALLTWHALFGSLSPLYLDIALSLSSLAFSLAQSISTACLFVSWIPYLTQSFPKVLCRVSQNTVEYPAHILHQVNVTLSFGSHVLRSILWSTYFLRHVPLPPSSIHVHDKFQDTFSFVFFPPLLHL